MQGRDLSELKKAVVLVRVRIGIPTRFPISSSINYYQNNKTIGRSILIVKYIAYRTVDGKRKVSIRKTFTYYKHSL